MKYHTKKHIRRFIFVPIAILIIGIVVYAWNVYARHTPYPTTFGVTFSSQYATSLGLDWRQTYTAALDDIGIRHFRIPVYWNDIEAVQGDVRLDDVRWMLDEAEKRGADAIVTIGRRVPRWPECHLPGWAKSLDDEQVQAAELSMIDTVVTELRGHAAVRYWQVQNEPFLGTFGECPKPDRAHIAATITAVRTLDPTHPIVVTDSGELGAWVEAAALGDILGVSMYRSTWNDFLGYFFYPLPPSYYSKKAELAKPLVDDIIVTELQAEPWVPNGILNASIEEQFRSMNPDRLRRNIGYVKQTGFSEAYLWGVEWWYWLKETHQNPEMWDTAKEIFIQP